MYFFTVIQKEICTFFLINMIQTIFLLKKTKSSKCFFHPKKLNFFSPSRQHFCFFCLGIWSQIRDQNSDTQKPAGKFAEKLQPESKFALFTQLTRAEVEKIEFLCSSFVKSFFLTWQSQKVGENERVSKVVFFWGGGQKKY